MIGNRANHIAEAIRQGQAEVELRYTIQRAIYGVGENPCNEWAEKVKGTETELGRLKLNPSVGKDIMTKAYICSPFCICPCFWPHSLLLCIPCSACKQCSLVEQAAKAHKLILFGSYLLLEIDPYPAMARASSIQVQPCSCLGGCENPTKPVREVIPLQDIKSVGVEKCLVENCGNPQAPDSFVVKLEGSTFPCVAVDMPMDAEQFAKQIMDRVNLCKASPQPLPQEWAEYKQKLFSSGMGMGMMGMGMGMGGMMQQQAMMNQQQMMMNNPQQQQMMMQAQMNPAMMQQQQMMMQQQNPAMMQQQQMMMQQQNPAIMQQQQQAMIQQMTPAQQQAMMQQQQLMGQQQPMMNQQMQMQGQPMQGQQQLPAYNASAAAPKAV